MTWKGKLKMTLVGCQKFENDHVGKIKVENNRIWKVENDLDRDS